MTVSAKQNWTNAGTGSSVASQGLVLASVPIAGNLLVVYAERGAGTGTLTIADSVGDAGIWTEITHRANTTEGVTCYGWWKIVGTPSGGLKTITVTNSVNAALTVMGAEYQSSVGGITWGLNGVATSNQNAGSTNPNPGAITLDATPSVITGYASTNNANSTAVATYTRESTALFFGADDVEDKFVATAGADTPSFTSASSAWISIGAAFKAAAAGGGGAIRLRFPNPMNGVGSGNQFFGDRLQ